ncbi:MAG: hypothetical protein IKI50_04030 [Clostridia bacterium]|nr:hypothetical protein [Clostridia bacterium]
MKHTKRIIALLLCLLLVLAMAGCGEEKPVDSAGPSDDTPSGSVTEQPEPKTAAETFTGWIEQEAETLSKGVNEEIKLTVTMEVNTDGVKVTIPLTVKAAVSYDPEHPEAFKGSGSLEIKLPGSPAVAISAYADPDEVYVRLPDMFGLGKETKCRLAPEEVPLLVQGVTELLGINGLDQQLTQLEDEMPEQTELQEMETWLKENLPDKMTVTVDESGRVFTVKMTALDLEAVFWQFVEKMDGERPTDDANLIFEDLVFTFTFNEKEQLTLAEGSFALSADIGNITYLNTESTAPARIGLTVRCERNPGQAPVIAPPEDSDTYEAQPQLMQYFRLKAAAYDEQGELRPIDAAAYEELCQQYDADMVDAVISDVYCTQIWEQIYDEENDEVLWNDGMYQDFCLRYGNVPVDMLLYYLGNSFDEPNVT